LNQLRLKLGIIVSAVTTLITVGSSVYVGKKLKHQGLEIEKSHQRSQIISTIPVLETSIWEMDSANTEAIMRGMFESPSTLRVQFIDNRGEVFAGLRREEHSRTLAADHSPVLDRQQAEKLQQAFDTIDGRNAVHFVEKDSVHWRAVSGIWHLEDSGTQFLGHLVIEFSLEESIVRSRSTMYQIIFAGFLTSAAVVIAIYIAMQFYVIRPVGVLLNATEKLSNGSFDHRIEIRSHDELAKLADSFNEMSEKIRRFTFHLQDLVAYRTSELQMEKNKLHNVFRHINEGILTFRENLIIEPEISNSLLNILELPRDELVGVSIVDVLFSRSNLSPDQQNLIRSTLNLIVSDQLDGWLAFELNNSHLPRDLLLVTANGTKLLDLAWSPIMSNGRTPPEMILTIRDLTEKSEMQRQVQEAKRQEKKLMEIVTEILHAGADSTRKALETAQGGLQHLLQQCEVGDTPHPSQSFPLLHTLKGNFRTLRLQGLVDSIHLTEDLISEQRSTGHLDLQSFIQLLQKCLAEIQMYQNALLKVWGQQSGLSNLSGLLGVMHQAMSDLYQTLEQETIPFGEISVRDAIPNWSTAGLDLVKDLLVHVLNNSLDHGYIRPQKSGCQIRPFGFFVQAMIDRDFVHLSFQDQGHGISEAQLQKLYKKNGMEFDGNEPFKILLESAVSSVESDVSQRSGRGVGLFYVKELVEQWQGRLQIHSQENEGFHIEIWLPQQSLIQPRHMDRTA
jgi:signal transduction histidine kinase